MISVTIVGDERLVAQLERMPASLQAILVRRMWSVALRVKARVQGKLSGQVLNVVTGALRRSIQADVEHGDGIVVGRVFSTGDVKYARIHEFGGRTRAHVIEPRRAQVLSFMSGGERIFARRVNHPGSQIPERSFLRSSLTEMRSEIVDSISRGVAQAAMQGDGE